MAGLAWHLAAQDSPDAGRSNPLRTCQGENETGARLAWCATPSGRWFRGDGRCRRDAQTRRSLFGFAIPDLGIIGGSDKRDTGAKDAAFAPLDFCPTRHNRSQRLLSHCGFTGLNGRKRRKEPSQRVTIAPRPPYCATLNQRAFVAHRTSADLSSLRSTDPAFCLSGPARGLFTTVALTLHGRPNHIVAS